MDKQRINVTIARRNYQLDIAPELEESIRAAVDSLNARIEDASTHFVNVDVRDILSIVLLEEEVRLIDAQRRNSGELKEMNDEIAALEKQLGAYLHSR
jgi:cell division protein ZapA (FtsZ GTPase activity inhibitor)